MEVLVWFFSHSVEIVLRWEISRVNETRFFIQPNEVPYCILTFWSDRPYTSSEKTDLFCLTQECEDEMGIMTFQDSLRLDNTVARSNFISLRQQLQEVYSNTTSNTHIVHFHHKLFQSFVVLTTFTSYIRPKVI